MTEKISDALLVEIIKESEWFARFEEKRVALGWISLEEWVRDRHRPVVVTGEGKTFAKGFRALVAEIEDGTLLGSKEKCCVCGEKGPDGPYTNCGIKGEEPTAYFRHLDGKKRCTKAFERTVTELFGGSGFPTTRIELMKCILRARKILLSFSNGPQREEKKEEVAKATISSPSKKNLLRETFEQQVLYALAELDRPWTPRRDEEEGK